MPDSFRDCRFNPRVQRSADVRADQGDPVPVSHLAAQRVGDAEHGIVHQDLDVFRELAAPFIPEGLTELREPATELRQNAPDSRALGHDLLEVLPSRAVPSDESRDPGDDLHRHLTCFPEDPLFLLRTIHAASPPVVG